MVTRVTCQSITKKIYVFANQIPKYAFNNICRRPLRKRPAGRPKNRWIDGILKDMEVLKVKNWKELTRNRKEWNELVEKAKAHPGL
jgi:hypothetical protein